MGSGFFMMSSAMEGLKGLSSEEQKECLELLGVDYLVGVYGYETYEDFSTLSKKGAELLAKGLRKLLKESHGDLARVDVVTDINTRGFPNRYKISFFK